MPSLTLDLITFDPGLTISGPEALAEVIMKLVEDSWDSGADLVMLPEFTWMAMEPLIAAGAEKPLQCIAETFWRQFLPGIQMRLSRPGKAVVLGTVPVMETDGGLRNRAPIFADGSLMHQDKLHLTPWEQAFTPGDTLHIWNFGGFRIAVIICLDIEIPELAARLRDSAVDLILCPSATETILGTERVNRCASARAVELGCYVGVTHLTGTGRSELIDVNVGRAALYRPSQAAFKDATRVEQTEDFPNGTHRLRVTLDHRALDVMRRMYAETNPASLGKKNAGINRLIHIESSPHPSPAHIP